MPLAISFTTPGTYTIDDDGIRGNGISVIRNASGAIILSFTHPADTMSFTTTVPGVNLIFNVLDSFGTANVTVGDLAVAAATPDSIVVRSMRSDAFITLVSNGTITEGGADTGADLAAAGLMMRAVNGIGTPSNAIETQVTFVEAQTTTGGINLANSGSVQIGGLSPDLNGLYVHTSGDINFSTTGFILAADGTGASSIHGGIDSGNVTLTAIGYDSDIFSNINQRMIEAPGGGVTLNAGRDVILGTSGANFNNDILATQSIVIRAGRDFQLDGTSDIRTGAYGGVVGGAIDIRAGRDINLSSLAGGLQTIQAFAANVILTTGPGGTFFENAGFPGAVQTSDNIILTADNVQINSGGLNTTGIGSITILPVTPGRAINLGTTLDGPAALGLSDAEFDLLFTLNVFIGDTNTGPVEFSAPLSPFIVDNLTVTSGSEILMRSTLSLPRTLTLRAGDDVFFTPGASFSSTNEGLVVVVDGVQNDGGVGGYGELGGTITVHDSVTLVGNGDNDLLNGSGANDVIVGNAGNDRLDGRAGADVLVGGLGSDTLIGGTGSANEMIGGPGDDVYVVSVLGDSLVEAAGEGTDRIETDLPSYTLKTNIENLTYTGGGSFSGTGTAAANVITGGAGSDTLIGLDGDDTLIGGGGAANTLIGGTGNDLYFVAVVGDSVVEAAGEGSDQVRTALSSYAMSANVETLVYIGGGAFNGVGNSGDNLIIGGAGNDLLNGADGADTLLGFGGNDMLIGGSGVANTMQGGLGDDSYFVAASGETIVEFAGEGTDQVNTGLAGFTLGANIENLVFTGAGAFVGTGNVLGNFIAGGGSADTLAGLDGNDTLAGNNGSDQLQGGAGQDLLIGGIGNDILDGGADADLLLFGNAPGAGNVDTVVGFQAGLDRFLLDRNVFTTLAAGTLPGSAFVVGSAAGDADDRIIYNSATGGLFYDADGNGAGAAVQFALLGTGLPLSAGDFVVF